MPDNVADKYSYLLKQIIDKVTSAEADMLERAGKIVADKIKTDNIVHVFGTGHSHMGAEEVLYRAGGLAIYNAILIPPLMLHRGARKSTARERKKGYIKEALENYNFSEDDVMVVISNSGVNAVPVEAALYSKEQGMDVVAITSLEYSKYAQTDNTEGKKLYQIADLVIDNHLPPGDAILEIDKDIGRVGPASTIIVSMILNIISLQAISILKQEGVKAIPYYKSSNIEGAEKHNQKIAARYDSKIKHL